MNLQQHQGLTVQIALHQQTFLLRCVAASALPTGNRTLTVRICCCFQLHSNLSRETQVTLCCWFHVRVMHLQSVAEQYKLMNTRTHKGCTTMVIQVQEVYLQEVRQQYNPSISEGVNQNHCFLVKCTQPLMLLIHAAQHHTHHPHDPVMCYCVSGCWLQNTLLTRNLAQYVMLVSFMPLTVNKCLLRCWSVVQKVVCKKYFDQYHQLAVGCCSDDRHAVAPRHSTMSHFDWMCFTLLCLVAPFQMFMYKCCHASSLTVSFLPLRQ